ncbi:MAG: GNAT family N-acetyltransferase [Chlamydiota bacterium]|nr:GNAT family N-acetyltransferase [Chlamydiota bacterium]
MSEFDANQVLELETERLILRKITETNSKDIYKLQSRPEVMRFIGKGVPRSEEEALSLFKLLLDHQNECGFSLCPTYEKSSGVLIGFAGLVHLECDISNPEVEVGYWFLPEYWGKGYATEAAKACIEWAFTHLSIDKIVGITHPDHKRSQHVLKKSGLKYIGASIYRGNDVHRFEVMRQG